MFVTLGTQDKLTTAVKSLLLMFDLVHMFFIESVAWLTTPNYLRTNLNAETVCCAETEHLT